MTKTIEKIEQFINVKGFENYEVSNLGRVRNKKTKRFLKAMSGTGDYLFVQLRKDGGFKNYRIHRLVGELFIKRPFDRRKNVVDHKDGNRQNNVESNLEWITQKENVKRAIERGTFGKLNREKVKMIRHLLKTDSRTVGELAEIFNVTTRTIYHVKNGETWSEEIVLA